MLIRDPRLLLCLALGLLMTATQGQNSTLYADGQLRVRGADVQNSRITVVPEFGDPFDVPLTGDHFALDLGLESSYLIRAVHAGCAAKEVVFDLSVPTQNRTQDFHFPFEILLEAFKANEEPYAYAQPVGAVFYDPSIEDLTYSTDYSRINQTRSLPSLIARMETHISLHPHPDNDLARYEALFDQDPNALPLNSTVPVAALPDSSTRYPVTARILSREDPPAVTAPIAVAIPTVPSAAIIQPTTKPEETAIPRMTNDQSELAMLPPVAPSSGARVPTHFAIGSSSARQAMHEFHKLPTMSIRIDRFGDAVSTLELRKVSHAYGAVFYFLDGAAITERAYTEALAKHATTTEPD